MKVVIGNNIYDPNKTPILLILDKEDKENIGNMLPSATKYCAYPDTIPSKEIQEWMAQYNIGDGTLETLFIPREASQND